MYTDNITPIQALWEIRALCNPMEAKFDHIKAICDSSKLPVYLVAAAMQLVERNEPLRVYTRTTHATLPLLAWGG